MRRFLASLAETTTGTLPPRRGPCSGPQSFGHRRRAQAIVEAEEGTGGTRQSFEPDRAGEVDGVEPAQCPALRQLAGDPREACRQLDDDVFEITVEGGHGARQGGPRQHGFAAAARQRCSRLRVCDSRRGHDGRGIASSPGLIASGFPHV